MSAASSFLDKIVNMTAIHDQELMEISLLKTLEELIETKEMTILKLDGYGRPFYQLNFKKEKYEVVWENFELSEHIQTGLQVVGKTQQPFSCKIDEHNLLTVQHILREKFQDVFFITMTDKPLSELDAHMIKGLLGIYRNFHLLLNESQQDQLTGLSNRKSFDSVINKIYNLGSYTGTLHEEEGIINERRGGNDGPESGFWLGLADLDNFKRVNDTWGHLYGDEVLLITAQLMQAHFRESDYLFRFGGEEFLIVLRAPNEEHAYTAFERFRETIAAHVFPQVGQITVSIGAVKMRPDIFITTLLDQADKAMYHAKQEGRNQTWIYEELCRKGILTEQEVTPGEIELF